MVGRAVDTTVWSRAARNIPSMSAPMTTSTRRWVEGDCGLGANLGSRVCHRVLPARHPACPDAVRASVGARGRDGSHSVTTDGAPRVPRPFRTPGAGRCSASSSGRTGDSTRTVGVVAHLAPAFLSPTAEVASCSPCTVGSERPLWPRRSVRSPCWPPPAPAARAARAPPPPRRPRPRRWPCPRRSSRPSPPTPPSPPRCPAAIKSKGTIAIAMDATYPPDEFIASDGSTIVGMDADLATAISQVMGLKPKLVNVTFDDIIPGLQSSAGAHPSTAWGPRRSPTPSPDRRWSTSSTTSPPVRAST